jgi:two-component system NtrC family sensor kinase
MLKFETSIRQKIKFGYYTIVVIIIGLSVFIFLEIGVERQRISSQETIYEFLNTTLELRRFEKNYFLYEKKFDFNENMRYLQIAQELLKGDISEKLPEFSEKFTKLKYDLEKYRNLMEQFEKLKGQKKLEKQNLELMIRVKGKEIVTLAEDILKIERAKLDIFLFNTRRNLLFSIVILSFGGIIIGQFLSKMIVTPLKSLEDKMKLIAEGRLEKVMINSKDREIVSLANAFNKMLKELEMRQKHLLQSEKLASLGTLLSGVAHELNNPLSNISSSCQILIEEFDEGDIEHKRELLKQIDEQTDRARKIVRSLLEFSRDSIFKKKELPLKKLFEETLMFIKTEIPVNVETILEIPEDITILADKQRIQQAFLNLIKNAMESIIEEGKVFIRAKKSLAISKVPKTEKEICEYPKYRGKCTGECPLEKDTVDIEIEDTGMGIPPEVLSKIFDPFFTTKDVGKGSGLGLYVVQEIIVEHGGCIGVDSKLGKGTCFIMRLPVEE